MSGKGRETTSGASARDDVFTSDFGRAAAGEYAWNSEDNVPDTRPAAAPAPQEATADPFGRWLERMESSVFETARKLATQIPPFDAFSEGLRTKTERIFKEAPILNEWREKLHHEGLPLISMKPAVIWILAKAAIKTESIA